MFDESMAGEVKLFGRFEEVVVEELLAAHAGNLRVLLPTKPPRTNERVSQEPPPNH